MVIWHAILSAIAWRRQPHRGDGASSEPAKNSEAELWLRHPFRAANREPDPQLGIVTVWVGKDNQPQYCQVSKNPGTSLACCRVAHMGDCEDDRFLG
jgi:hypothetical protein